MAGRPAKGGPGYNQGKGAGKMKAALGSYLGASLGGGGDNPAYGQDPSQIEANPDIAQYGTENPYKPLNWFGKATGQPDQYGQYRTFSAELGAQSGANQQMEAIKFQHEKELEAIKNSNLSAREKAQAKMAADNRLDEMNNAVLTSRGFIANPANVGAMNSATAGMIPSLAPTMMQQGVEHTAANIGLINSEALKNRFGHLGAGDVVFPYSQLGPGMSAMNLHPSDRENEMAAAMKQPPLASGLTYYLNGRAIQAKSGAPAGGGLNAGFGDAAAGGLGLGSGVPPDWHPPMSPPGGNPAIGAGAATPSYGNPFANLPAIGQAISSGLQWMGRNVQSPSIPGYAPPGAGMAPQAPSMADLIKQQEEEKRRQLLMPAY